MPTNPRRTLKGKIVILYEQLFRGEDPSEGNPNFWDEFFLLRVNLVQLEKEFDKLNDNQILVLKGTFNTLFQKCILALSSEEENGIRMTNAMMTLNGLIRGVYRKSQGDYGFDLIDLLVGFDSAESQLQALVDVIDAILNDDVNQHPAYLKDLALKLILSLVTVTDNVSQNTILEYLMIHPNLFDTVVKLLASPNLRVPHGYDALLLLTILVQYRKYESTNPYIVKLSILDDEVALAGLAQVVNTCLLEFNQHHQAKHAEPEGGFLSSLSSMVGSMFVSSEGASADGAVKTNEAILLALYEAVHLNRNFISALVTSMPDFDNNDFETFTKTRNYSGSSSCDGSVSTNPTPPATPTNSEPPPLPGYDRSSSGGSSVPAAPPTPTGAPTQPSNLLVAFVTYTSVLMQDIKDNARYQSAKLCLITLHCITEDQYANSLMHDVNMNFRVPIFRLPMRHRKGFFEKNPPSRPLACAIMDLVVEFIQSHMMKQFPMELYIMALAVAQRLLCYEKRCRTRLNYPWKELWTGLISLLKFLMSHETLLIGKHDIFLLAKSVTTIFNLFITYGDTFLPNPSLYDELYYEIIRMHQVFENLYTMALRYTTMPPSTPPPNGENPLPWRDSAVRLTNSLVNIRAIINHFSPKIDTWAVTNHLSSLDEQQVLDVVRSNYDTLTLKLQESLDQYERYSEKPLHPAFFTQLVRGIIQDVKKNSLSTKSLTTQLSKRSSLLDNANST